MDKKLIYIAITVSVLSIFVTIATPKSCDKEYIELITEHAFLEGYHAAILNQHHEEAWEKVKGEFIDD